MEFDYELVPDFSDPDQNAYIFRANWSGFDYEFCEWLHLGLFFDLECHNLMIDLKGWWTFNGEPLGDTLLPGFVVNDSLAEGDLQSVRLLNQGGTPGQIIGMHMAKLTEDHVLGLFGSVEEMFPHLRNGGMLDPKESVQGIEWSEVFVMDPAGGMVPLNPDNPADFPAESFFDVFTELTVDPPPGEGVAVPGITIAPNDVLVLAELLEHENNAGEPDLRWTWEIHEAHGLDFGDAPDQPYQTLAANDGARHVARGVRFGRFRDTEPDGQPTTVADGDDVNPAGGIDDEDGFFCLGVFLPGQAVPYQLHVDGTGLVSAWADWNQDGDWFDSGEQFLTDYPISSNILYGILTVPASATAGPVYLRFRVSTLNGLPPFGFAPDGEVEDYRIDVLPDGESQYDWGDAPDDPTLSYYFPTLASSSGARHLLGSGLMLGQLVDPEQDGQQSVPADGDDLNPPSQPNDEDGLVLPVNLLQGATNQITVISTGPGLLNAWLDWDNDDSWALNAEHVIVDQNVINGPNTLSFYIPSTAVPWTTYLRLRLSTMPGLSQWGPAPDGEVEDYQVAIEEFQGEQVDWGDAPDFEQVPGYPTLAMHNGAHHLIDPGLYLGPRIDGEGDGQPTLPAHGDDIATTDDEDGVTFLKHLVKGHATPVTVRASAPGILNAWFDFDRNTSWADPGEHVLINVGLAAGDNPLVIQVPDYAKFGLTYCRFRFSTEAGLSFEGPAPNGEVEDYRVAICELADTVINVNADDEVVLDWKTVGGAASYAIYGSNLLESFPATWNVIPPAAAGPPWTDTAWFPRTFYFVVAEP